jgi:hypothetical protein
MKTLKVFETFRVWIAEFGISSKITPFDRLRARLRYAHSLRSGLLRMIFGSLSHPE